MNRNAKTIRVKLNQGCYVVVDGVEYGGYYEAIPNTKPQEANAKWVGDELWASPADVEGWTTGSDPARPVVTVIGNRSIEEAASDDTVIEPTRHRPQALIATTDDKSTMDAERKALDMEKRALEAERRVLELEKAALAKDSTDKPSK